MSPVKRRSGTNPRRQPRLSLIPPIGQIEPFEVLRQPLYDTFVILPEREPIVVTTFVCTVGQEGRTLVDTNMRMAGCLPCGQSFTVQGFVLDFLNAPALPDKVQFLRSYSFTFLICGKIMYEGLCHDLVPKETGSHLFPLFPRVKIRSQEPFTARFSKERNVALDPYGKGIRARIQLVGWLKRPTQ